MDDRPQVGQAVMVGTIPTIFRVGAAMTAHAYSVVEQTVEPGRLVWPHVHAKHDQLAIVTQGELGLRVGDSEWVAGPGELAYRPRNLPHAVWNASSTPAVFLEITSPGDFEDYFLALSRLGPNESEARGRLQSDYGLVGVADWIEELGHRYGVSV